MDGTLDAIFVGAAMISAIAAMIAAIRAGRAERGVHHMTLSVNGRLDALLAGARAEGELQGRKDEVDAEAARDAESDED